MNKKILILGASGNFGSKIAKLLAKENIEIILAGRQKNSLIELKKAICHGSLDLIFLLIWKNMQICY